MINHRALKSLLGQQPSYAHAGRLSPLCPHDIGHKLLHCHAELWAEASSHVHADALRVGEVLVGSGSRREEGRIVYHIAGVYSCFKQSAALSWIDVRTPMVLLAPRRQPPSGHRDTRARRLPSEGIDVGMC